MNNRYSVDICLKSALVPFIYLTISVFNVIFAARGLWVPKSSVNDYPVRSFSPANQCPPLEIANGLVRLGRRTARFRCQKNYTLVGDQVIQCFGHEWSGDVPVCAAPGCLKLRSPKQGTIQKFRDSSYVSITCNPGYSVAGSPTVYCDGRYWNASYTQIANMCKKSTRNPTISCDFEGHHQCGWTSDDPERVTLEGPNSFGYRPYGLALTDHSGSGQMLVVWSSLSSIAPVNRLYSPVYEEKESESCFTFWYHLGGYDTFTHPPPFKVYIKPEQITLSDLNPWEFVTPAVAYGVWTPGQIYVPKLNQDWQIVLEFNVWQNVYGFDDFSLQDVTKCAARTTPPNTGIKDNWLSCKNRCSSALSPEPKGSCSCVVYCTILETCCPDYQSFCGDNSTREDNNDFMDSNDTNETLISSSVTNDNSTSDYQTTQSFNTVKWFFTEFTTIKSIAKTQPILSTNQSKIIFPTINDLFQISSTASSQLEPLSTARYPLLSPLLSPMNKSSSPSIENTTNKTFDSLNTGKQLPVFNYPSTVKLANQTFVVQPVRGNNSLVAITSQNKTQPTPKSVLFDELLNSTETNTTNSSIVLLSKVNKLNGINNESKALTGEKAELSVSQGSSMQIISILIGAFLISSLVGVVILWKRHKKYLGSSVSADSELRFLAQEED